jgi:hypothetical protein
VHTLSGSTLDAGPATRTSSARAWGRFWWTGGTALAVAVLLFCYLRIAGTTPVVSDGAGNALEAWDMLHGNWLLHGWWATDVEFWATQLPLLALIEAVAGLRTEVVHVSAAITYTLLVLLAAFLAKGKATGAAAAFRALLAVLIMLAPELGAPAYVTLGSPDHLGAAGLPVLLTLVLLDRAPRRRWVPVAVAAVLAWGLLGDQLVLAIGVAPLVVLCVARALVVACRSPASLPHMVHEFSLVFAGGVAMTAAGLVNALVSASGGLRTPAPGGMTVFGGFRTPRLAVRNLLSIFGADPGGSHYLFASNPGGVPGYVRGGLETGFAIAHLAGVALVAAAIAVAGRRLWRSLPLGAGGQQDLVSDLIVVSIAINVGIFVFLFYSGDMYRAEEIVPILPLGAALTGRLLGDRLAHLVLDRHGPRWTRRAVIPALVTVAACYCAMLGYAAAQPQVPPASAALAQWLVGHRLNDGLAGFWEASSVTLDTGGANVMRSVAPNAMGQVAPYSWEADMRTFNPRSDSAHFLVLARGYILRENQAIATFGRPTKVYHYQAYTILVWHGNLLRKLPAPVVWPGAR